MITVLLVIHLLIAIAMVTVILLQRSEGGALGIGGGGMSGFMTGRSASNMLTKTTAILAAAFMVTSLTLSLMSSGNSDSGSILDRAPAAPVEQAPAPASEPTAPVAR